MRVALTGTPGTGKTTVADRIETDLEVIHLGELVDDEGLTVTHDPDRRTDVVDLDRLRRRLEDHTGAIFEGHIAHHLEVDRVLVLRCHPDELERRLRSRTVSERSIRENAESEALDIILAEAVDRQGSDRVTEIDTTGRSIDAVVHDIERALAGEGLGTVGIVDFTDYLR